MHDERGRMVKTSQATVDGTLEGPDAIAELAAMHLHRLGAARAKYARVFALHAEKAGNIEVTRRQAGLILRALGRGDEI